MLRIHIALKESIKVKNESSSKSFGLFNGRIGTNEFDGSIIYIKESPQSPFSDDAMFLMWEYDEKADTLLAYLQKASSSVLR